MPLLLLCVENANNASHYQNRFTAYNDLGRASGSNTNMWFSWSALSHLRGMKPLHPSSC